MNRHDKNRSSQDCSGKIGRSAGGAVRRPGAGDSPGKPHGFSPYQGPDRRRYPRHTVQVPIEVQFDDNRRILCAETSDLSRNGCYIRMLNPLSVGLWIHATLWLDAVSIRIAGRIVTRHPNFGNGIMFLKIQDHDAEALAAYMESVTAESNV